jgi:hypothetical protein
MYDSLFRTEMLPEDLREDEPKFGHVSRHRRTHHGRLMRVHSKLPCRRAREKELAF